ncbi:MAG: DNA mismatch repair endonuclease MutL [Thermodesulfovibrionales bacterium]|nr:DNA mismatch repair endonuclease MutL [Thermodesulfovibrionales bacterium]
MPSIQILPEHLRNVIAAGEVIERPASVVKELIENAIDAGSRNITVEILYGGKKLIKVSDDGCGMDRDDALLSIERYATSKISKIEDLFKLKTLGFRGEALASIAAVSRLTIETGIDTSLPGTLIEIAGGEIESIRDAPPLKGTIVTVRDLFFNTPARRKFLRANSTELNHVIETVISEALADFKLGFKLFADNTELLFLPSVYEPRERITQVFGMESIEHMDEFEHEFDDMTIHAFISRPPELRAKKTNQYIFVNQRPVRDPVITKAVYDGLSGILPEGKHPLFVIYLKINPSKVDFNVHPTKREIRFSDSSSVYEFVRNAVENACVKKLKVIQFEASGSSDRFHEPISASGPIYAYNTTDSAHGLFERASCYETSLPSERDIIFLGEIFIIMFQKDGLLIMDKHAAHERVLYERYLKGEVIPKRLLFPKQVRLQPALYRSILDNKEILNEMGLEIEDFGSGTVIVRTLPEFYDENSLQSILDDIGSVLKTSAEGMDSEEEIFDKKKALAASLACHKSIRGRDFLNIEEVKTLYSELLKASDPYHCPHGRPTLIKITLNELLKMFGRL